MSYEIEVYRENEVIPLKNFLEELSFEEKVKAIWVIELLEMTGTTLQDYFVNKLKENFYELIIPGNRILYLLQDNKFILLRGYKYKKASFIEWLRGKQSHKLNKKEWQENLKDSNKKIEWNEIKNLIKSDMLIQAKGELPSLTVVARYINNKARKELREIEQEKLIELFNKFMSLI